jgi:hypothetical protein
MPRPKSKAQARFFGAIAGGKARRKGFSRLAAKNDLRGVKYATLPPRLHAKKYGRKRTKKR